MIFKIPSRAVPEHHFGAAKILFPEQFLSYSILHQAGLSSRPSTPSIMTSLLGVQKLLSHYTDLDPAGTDILPPVLGQNKSTSSLRKRNHTLNTPLGPDAKQSYHIFVLPALLTKSLQHHITFSRPPTSPQGIRGRA